MRATAATVAALSLLGFSAAKASAATLWAEDFQAFSNGSKLLGGGNNWAAVTDPVSHNLAWTAPPNTFTPESAADVFIRNTFVAGSATGDGRASKSALTLAAGLSSLSFDFLAPPVDSRSAAGIQLRDSANGGVVTMVTDFAGWMLDNPHNNPAMSEWVGDYGAYNLSVPQSVTLTVDYGADTIQAFITAKDGVTPIYAGGFVSRTSSLQALPADFVPDTLVMFGRFNNGAFDNLEYTQVPEPTSLALLGVGAAMLLRRRR